MKENYLIELLENNADIPDQDVVMDRFRRLVAGAGLADFAPGAVRVAASRSDAGIPAIPAAPLLGADPPAEPAASDEPFAVSDGGEPASDIEPDPDSGPDWGDGGDGQGADGGGHGFGDDPAEEKPAEDDDGWGGSKLGEDDEAPPGEDDDWLR